MSSTAELMGDKKKVSELGHRTIATAHLNSRKIIGWKNGSEPKEV
jgi:hypothetical protein